MVGTENLNGKAAYHLKLAFRTGATEEVWVDKETFLDVQTATLRRINGREHRVVTTQSDFRPEAGLMWPHTLETRVVGARDSEILRITKVEVNPSLDDARFAKPN